MLKNFRSLKSCKGIRLFEEVEIRETGDRRSGGRDATTQPPPRGGMVDEGFGTREAGRRRSAWEKSKMIQILLNQ